METKKHRPTKPILQGGKNTRVLAHDKGWRGGRVQAAGLKGKGIKRKVRTNDKLRALTWAGGNVPYTE